MKEEEISFTKEIWIDTLAYLEEGTVLIAI
jgi:hypothetical protein